MRFYQHTQSHLKGHRNVCKHQRLRAPQNDKMNLRYSQIIETFIPLMLNHQSFMCQTVLTPFRGN